MKFRDTLFELSDIQLSELETKCRKNCNKYGADVYRQLRESRKIKDILLEKKDRHAILQK